MELICFLAVDPDAVADSVTDVVFKGIELLFLSLQRPLVASPNPGSLAKRHHVESTTTTSPVNNPNKSKLKKNYNSASTTFETFIARAKSEHIGKISKRLARLALGICVFLSLAF
ncbi:unnamed protein product [Pieris macdunnoughi]|uniref:Uncharacterized protein n=1 Tax=Pieris macdunnoughi TaxID=345717 RepID=A0A821QUG4_9NEOP|nr:unnamed protein product [Pieris macdunnoughi]